MSLVPGLGIVQGMALTLRQFFEPKVTIMYPEVRLDPPHKFRGRLQLLYDEWGTLKCETCFQCAQACPIECIDMGGMDTRGRYHVHWGAPETYGERREESALRRSGRTVPDPAYRAVRARSTSPRSTPILEDLDHDPARMLDILEATQAAYGYLPVAALKRISHRTGAWYAMIYGTASYYAHLRFEPPTATAQAAAVDAHRPAETTYLAALDAAIGGGAPGAAAALTWPTCSRRRRLADDPARASRCRGPARPRCRHEGRRVRGPAPGHPRPRARSATIATIAESGLRGRGGAGFPTGDKWRAGRARPRRRDAMSWPTATGPTRHRGTDRTLMTLDPYAVVEGAAIAALRDRGRPRPSSPSARRTPRPSPRSRRPIGGRIGRGLHRLGRPGLRARHHGHASGRSRAPTCWARRPSC